MDTSYWMNDEQARRIWANMVEICVATCEASPNDRERMNSEAVYAWSVAIHQMMRMFKACACAKGNCWLETCEDDRVKGFAWSSLAFHNFLLDVTETLVKPRRAALRAA